MTRRPCALLPPGAGILSIDVHPEGSKLLTGGFDKVVRVWSTRPILSPALEADEAVPRLLATLTEHEQPVNIARFSRRGGLIASGAGDVVLIHELRPGRGIVVSGVTGQADMRSCGCLAVVISRVNNGQ